MKKKDKDIKITEKKDKNGGIHLNINCTHCGKPISKNTDFGMECEDECARKNWEKENGRPFNCDDEIDKFFGEFGGPLGSFLNAFKKPGQEDIDINILKDKLKGK